MITEIEIKLPEQIQDSFLDTAGRHISKTEQFQINYLDYVLLNDKQAKDQFESAWESTSSELYETSEPVSMGLKVFTKFAEMKTYERNATIRQADINNILETYGVAVKDEVLKQLQEQEIIDMQTELFNLYLELGERSRIKFLDATLTKMQMLIRKWFGYEFPMHLENKNSARIFLSKILMMANFVTVSCRRGPANFVVVNMELGALIQDSASFSYFDINTESNRGELTRIHKVGTIAGLTIFVNPRMSLSDYRILVGRKVEDSDSPGVHIIEYKRDITEYVSEQTGDHKFELISKRAQVELGNFPETFYITQTVATGPKPLWRRLFKL